MPRDELVLIEILSRCRQLARVTARIDKAALAADSDAQSLLFWPLATLGEECGRLSEELRARHPEVPWARVVGFRNFLVHAYDHVDIDLVWEIATARVAAFEQQVDAVFREEYPLVARAVDQRGDDHGRPPA